ncbi:MAG: zf-HC2 domain-containing protein, partial [Planctomycetota bacterium]|nr:zf-HC2 domain-containing protein [Planctomycetota bacterium]
MNCPDITSQLPLLLYDELDAEVATEIEHHLETCAACSEHWAELKKTKGLLDEWAPIKAGSDVKALLDDAPVVVATLPLKSGLPWKSMLTGLAAGLLLMATLFFVGVSVERSDGRLTIAFGQGAEPTNMILDHLSEFNPQEFEARIQQATFERIDQTNFEMGEELSSFFRRWDELQGQQRDELLNLLARAIQNDVLRLEQNIASIA